MIFGQCFFGWCGTRRFFDKRRGRIGLHDLYIHIPNLFIFFGKDLGRFRHRTRSLRCRQTRHTARSAFFYGFRRIRNAFTFHFRTRSLRCHQTRHTARSAFFYGFRRIRNAFTFHFRTRSLRCHQTRHTARSAFFYGFRRIRNVFTFHFQNRRQRLFNLCAACCFRKIRTINPAFEIFTEVSIITQEPCGPQRKEKNQGPPGKRRLQFCADF